MQCMWGICGEIIGSRNKGETRADQAADKVSVSAVIHGSTQGHDLDQGLVVDPAQRGRRKEREQGRRETARNRQRDSVCRL